MSATKIFGIGQPKDEFKRLRFVTNNAIEILAELIEGTSREGLYTKDLDRAAKSLARAYNLIPPAPGKAANFLNVSPQFFEGLVEYDRKIAKELIASIQSIGNLPEVKKVRTFIIHLKDAMRYLNNFISSLDKAEPPVLVDTGKSVKEEMPDVFEFQVEKQNISGAAIRKIDREIRKLFETYPAAIADWHYKLGYPNWKDIDIDENGRYAIALFGYGFELINNDSSNVFDVEKDLLNKIGAIVNQNG